MASMAPGCGSPAFNEIKEGPGSRSHCCRSVRNVHSSPLSCEHLCWAFNRVTAEQQLTLHCSSPYYCCAFSSACTSILLTCLFGMVCKRTGTQHLLSSLPAITLCSAHMACGQAGRCQECLQQQPARALPCVTAGLLAAGGPYRCRQQAGAMSPSGRQQVSLR